MIPWSEMRSVRWLVRALCVLLVVEGPPLWALGETGQFEPRQEAGYGREDEIGLPEESGPPSIPAELLAPGSRFATSGELAQALVRKATLETVPFVSGWNLVSIPEEPADPAPASVLAAIAGAYLRAYAYDACDPADPWKVFDPTDPGVSDLTAIDHRIGFWIETTAALELPSEGTLPASTTFQLCPGWNLIGFPSGQPRPVPNALAPIAGKYLRVYGFDGADPADPWAVYDVAVPDWANDLREMEPGRGYWVLVTEATTLTLANQGPDPVVALTAPADLAVVTTFTEVRGTVRSPLLEGWTLTYQQIGEGDPVVLARGVVPVENGVLATFDPTLLLNGLYELKLVATDLQGLEIETAIAVSVEGGLKLGNFTLSFVDLAIPLSGLDIEVVRTYDSRDKNQGDFGFGWSLDIRQGSYRNNRPPGDGWRIRQGFLPCEQPQELESHLATVRLSDSEIYRFRPRLVSPAPTLGGCFATARFDFVDGPVPGAKLEVLGNTSVFWENASDRVIDVETFEIYEPEDVRLTTRDGRVFDLDLEDGVTRIADRNGNEVRLSSTGIRHSSGVEARFERDTAGRIVTITDTAGRTLDYQYDPSGDLVRFLDRAARETSFDYLADHYLRAIRRGDGRELITAEYDPDGRVSRQCNADLECTEVVRDLAAGVERRIDPTARVTTYRYDSQGNVVSVTDGLGNETTLEYNGRGQVTRRRDPTGAETTWSYGATGDLASTTAPHPADRPASESTTTFAYDAFGDLTGVTRPDGSRFTVEYDGNGNQTRVRDGEGNVLSSATYDSRGNLLTESDAYGTIRYEDLSSFGEPRREVDPLGVATTSAYDAAGQLASMTRGGATATFTHDADGRETRAEYPGGLWHEVDYDDRGRWTSLESPLTGRLTRRLDDGGRVTGWELPGDREIRFDRDAAGRVTAEVDAAGRRTAFTHDAAGRLATIEDPRGGVTRFERDAAGRVTRKTDASGAAIQVTYDVAGQPASLQDPLGRTWSFGQGATWSEITDPLGHTTRVESDVDSTLARIVHPDATELRFEYVDGAPEGERADYPSAIVDEGGHRREIAYNAVGQIASATDRAGAVWTYQYTGTDLTRVVAPGGATVVEEAWDGRGNLIERRYPDGGRVTLGYGPGPDPQTITLPSGIVVTQGYDLEGRLLQRSTTSGEQESYAWGPAGDLDRHTDATGTTRYTYDVAGRLAAVERDDGAAVAFGRDALGRVVEVTVTGPGGGPVQRTEYGYDAAGQLVSVTDPTTGVTTLEYDAAGRMSRRTLPNGVVSTVEHDLRGRVARLTHLAPDATVLSERTYVRGPMGEPLRVTDEAGRVLELTYDSALRVASERRYDEGGALVLERSFEYDAAGNRTAEVRGGDRVDYAYLSGDRLSTLRRAGAVAEQLDWDADGRVSTITRAGASRTLAYDSKDALRSVAGAEGTTTYRYDAVGRRVSASDGAATRTFVAAPAMGEGLESVQLATDGSETSVYAWAGDQPLARVTGASAAYYLTDAQGSVIAISDADGAVVARFDYDSFGETYRSEGDTAAPPSAGGDWRFHGAWLESSTGFYHFRAREYDPHLGRFLTRDLGEPDVLEPESFHPYAFAYGNPYLFSDPTGLFSISEVNITAAVQNIIAAIRQYALHRLKEKVREKIGEALANLFLKWLESVLTGGATDLSFPAGLEAWRLGGLFETSIQDVVCDAIGNGADFMWFEAKVRQSDGEPFGNGYSCSERATGRRSGPFLPGERYPDILVRREPPLSKTRTTLVVAEIKLSISTFYKAYISPGRRKGQWRAIWKHAVNYSYPPRFVLFISLRHGTDSQQRTLEWEIRSKGLAGFVFSLL